ncbi:MAG: hypothetical protein RR766_05215, partial [Longicatena sp.]
MKKLINKYGKKKVFCIAGVLVVIACLLTGGTYYLLNKKELVLKQDVFSVEYGDTISMDAKTYLKKTDPAVLKDTKVLLKLNEISPTEVGTYKGTIEYKKEKLNLTINVKDTTSPVFDDFKDTVNVQLNAKDVDLTKYFKATDLSDTTIMVDSKDENNAFDISKEGSYKVIVTASDKYENKVTKDATVKVMNDTKDLTKTNEGTTPINEETKKEQDKVAAAPNTPQVEPGNNTNEVVERPAPAPVTPAPTPAPSPAPVTPKPTPACDPNAY